MRRFDSSGGGRKLAVIMLALAIMLQTSICWATLQSEMQGMFNTMTNVTDGGYYQAPMHLINHKLR